MYFGFPQASYFLRDDEIIEIMDCEESFDPYSVAEHVDGSQNAYHYLDPKESDDRNCEMFLQHHHRLATEMTTVHAKYLRLCFEYFFVAIEKGDECLPVCWVQYFRNFCMKVRREINSYSRQSYLEEVGKNCSIDLSGLAYNAVKSFLSCTEKENLRRIDNQVRSMNNCVWHCAATVSAIFRDFIALDSVNLSMDFEYQVTEQRIALFRSNTKFMTTLRMSAEADIKELARICRTMKDNNNLRSQFG